MEFELFHLKTWTPLARFGLTNTLFVLNAETLIYTWIALGVLLTISLLARWSLRRPHSIPGHLTLMICKSFSDMIKQSAGTLVPRYFFFISSIFLFIFTCNALVLIPGMEEPTKDINTTLSLALLSFFYAQKETLKSHGLVGYVLEYCKVPFTLFPNGFKITAIPGALLKIVANTTTAILSLPLELLGKIANIISLSLRLFGNIFGSSVIGGILKYVVSGSIIWQSLALITGLNLIATLFFGLFESFIQAFVFSVLSLTYISMGANTVHEEQSGAHS